MSDAQSAAAQYAYNWMADHYGETWTDAQLAMNLWCSTAVLQDVYRPSARDGPGFAAVLEECYLAVTNATPNKSAQIDAAKETTT